jgi:NADPH2:quinone reductase
VQDSLVVDCAERFAEGRQALAQWLTQGQLNYQEDIARDIENTPQAFIGMLQGKNLGKQLVQIAEVQCTRLSFGRPGHGRIACLS